MASFTDTPLSTDVRNFADFCKSKPSIVRLTIVDSKLSEDDIGDMIDIELKDKTVVNMMKRLNFSNEEQIACVKRLLPDDAKYTDFNHSDLVVKFELCPPLYWGIGDIMCVPPVSWPMHWIIGVMRLRLLQEPWSRKRAKVDAVPITAPYDTMDKIWTSSGYAARFYKPLDQEDFVAQMTQAHVLANLLRTICPPAQSDYVDVFHIVNINRKGLGNKPLEVLDEKRHPWEKLHVFACYGYGCYCGNARQPLFRLRLHRSVASIASFGNENAVFAVLADTEYETLPLETSIPEICVRCKKECKLQFMSRTNRDEHVPKDPTDLTNHIAVCTHKDCYYVYGCPTYYFKQQK